MKKVLERNAAQFYTSTIETVITCDSNLSAVKLLNVKGWDLSLQHNLKWEI